MSTPPASVAERVARERHAADETELYENVKALHQRYRHVFRCPAVRKADHWFETRIRERAAGGTVMDYGCYDGTYELWRFGSARMVGIDISETAIAEARARYGDKGEFQVADAHDLRDFADGSFDLIVGSGILHHLDLELAAPEIRRVLRPGGSAMFIEPLGDNPLAKIFRLLTPKARTADERPLDAKTIKRLDRLFSRQEHYFCGLVSTPVGVVTSYLPLTPDNLLLKLSSRIDDVLRHTPLKWWARAVYIHWTR